MEERTNVYEKIVECLTNMLGDKGYSEGTAFADLGMKSVNYSSMINVLEDEFDVEIPFMDFRRKATIGEAVDFVCQQIDG